MNFLTIFVFEYPTLSNNCSDGIIIRVGILINRAIPGLFQILLPVFRHNNDLENITVPLFNSVEYVFLTVVFDILKNDYYKKHSSILFDAFKFENRQKNRESPKKPRIVQMYIDVIT